VSLNTTFVRLRYTYNFNYMKFAIRNGYSAKFRQVRSSGSPLIQMNAYYNSFKSDSSLFPIQLIENTLQTTPVNNLSINGISIGAGYAYTFVLQNHYFFSLMGVPCIDAQWRRYDTQTTNGKNYFLVAGSLTSKAQFGYNSKKFYTLFLIGYELNSYSNKQYRFQSQYYSAEFNIGYRFGVPEMKIMKRFK
jgi:hypothetical protein